MQLNRLFYKSLLLTLSCFGGFFTRSQAQTNVGVMPVVTIWATDPNASFSGDTGTFTLRREGPTNATLNVFYRIGGTASNGVDYATIGNIVTIPAGERTNTVLISPINNGQTQVETVVLTLAPSPAVPPVNYIIGNPSNAVVFIRPANVTNLPPVVRITSPVNGAVFYAPLNLPIFAYAHDFDGFVTSVEFFEDTNSIGFGQRVPGPTTISNELWTIVWSNALVGVHTLTAEATDNSGGSTSSDPVKITILPLPPPPTNRPPIVTIVAIDPIAIEGTNCWPWFGLTNPVPTWSNWIGATPLRCFTNCGPKNAVFDVRRFGDTNEDLTVPYDIGGTASNGVDYVALPGVVTIPAGQRNVLIPIVPIDDGPPDITSTVILGLRASTNVPADYLLGFPRRAAALILDGPFPRPLTGMLADRCFHLNASGPDGAWFRVEYANDLANWMPVCTNQVIQGAIDFIDPDAQSDSVRFYRAVPQNSAP